MTCLGSIERAPPTLAPYIAQHRILTLDLEILEIGNATCSLLSYERTDVSENAYISLTLNLYMKIISSRVLSVASCFKRSILFENYNVHTIAIQGLLF